MAKPKPLILVVEDDKQIAKMISEQLEAADMVTQVYHRANGVLRFLQNNFANLLLLDVRLPDQSGFTLVEELRQQNINIPIIFLTADDSEIYKVKGLEIGGDDYITKPFSFPELIARIHAVLRRAETAYDYHVTRNATISQKPFEFCGAQVNPMRMELTFPSGKTEKIGRKELGIITYLHQNPNTVITRRSLIHSVWGIHADVRSRSLDQYIVKIRNCFNSHGQSLDAFKTIHGVGYIYNREVTAEEEAEKKNAQEEQ
ncbi:MAG: winged helix family two component transcriptional regulator [Puniceicoccaceae bacterium 5H]|nr:MAG: winged helix family two component transcriptional regulator [Puniceicoccaceae bacterium 5H]